MFVIIQLLSKPKSEMLQNESVRFRTFILDNEDTDLNANPEQNPELSTTLFFLEIVFSSASFYLHYCLYRSTTRKHFRNKIFIIGKLLTCYSVIAPIITFYAFIYGNIFLTYNYPNSETLGTWFCYANKYVCHTTIMYFGAFTLFSGVMKYGFIVHNDKVKDFGEERVKHIVLNLHLVIPATMSALNVISTGNVDHMNGISRCWIEETFTSPAQNVTLLDTQSSTDLFCQDRKYEVSQYLGEEAALYIEPILRTMCAGVSSFYILTTCNMVELVLYILLFKRLDR